MKQIVKRCFLAVLLALLSNVALAEEDWQKLVAEQGVADPYEGFNRKVFVFNDWLDGWVLKPVTKGYRAVTPDPVEKGVSNIFSNLGEVTTFVNDLLQGKLSDAGVTGSRFLINSTFGLLGLVDVASGWGLEGHDEDFGQTLAVWGYESSNYIVLPFFGPSTLRDGFSRVADWQTDPLNDIDHERTYYTVKAFDVVNTRAGLLAAEEMIIGDRYTFIRDAWMQAREDAISDGVAVSAGPGAAEDDFFNDGF